MSTRIQAKFDSLKQCKKLDRLWDGKKNSWLCELSLTQRGTTAEILALDVLGGRRENNNKSGYNIVVGNKLIEVVSSRVHLKNDYPMVTFHQIRMRDQFTHICFVVIYPDDVRMFLVPREEIPVADLHHCHGKDGAFEIYNIETRKVNELFIWMTKHEVL